MCLKFSTGNYGIGRKIGHKIYYPTLPYLITLPYLRCQEILETQTHFNVRLDEKIICERKSSWATILQQHIAQWNNKQVRRI